MKQQFISSTTQFIMQHDQMPAPIFNTAQSLHKAQQGLINGVLKQFISY